MGGLPILVLEDEPAVAKTLERLFSRYRPVVVASTREETISRIAEQRLAAVVTDLKIGDDERAGFAALAAAAASQPGCPLLVITGSSTHEDINLALRLGAWFASKPAGERELAAFLQRVLAYDLGIEPNLAAVVCDVSNSLGLTPREREILTWHVQGGTREELLESSTTGRRTYRDHVTALLAKANAGHNMEHVVNMVLRRALRMPKKTWER